MAVRIVVFTNIRTDVEPHLLAGGGEKMEAELADARNVRTDTGAIVTRPGFLPVRRYVSNGSPMILFSRERMGPIPAEFAQDHAENGGIYNDSGTPKLVPPYGD